MEEINLKKDQNKHLTLWLPLITVIEKSVLQEKKHHLSLLLCQSS